MHRLSEFVLTPDNLEVMQQFENKEKSEKLMTKPKPLTLDLCSKYISAHSTLRHLKMYLHLCWQDAL